MKRIFWSVTSTMQKSVVLFGHCYLSLSSKRIISPKLRQFLFPTQNRAVFYFTIGHINTFFQEQRYQSIFVENSARELKLFTFSEQEESLYVKRWKPVEQKFIPTFVLALHITLVVKYINRTGQLYDFRYLKLNIVFIIVSTDT